MIERWLDFLQAHPYLKHADTVVLGIVVVAWIVCAIVLKVKTGDKFKDIFF
jgi:hypothetical protein